MTVTDDDGGVGSDTLTVTVDSSITAAYYMSLDNDTLPDHPSGETYIGEINTGGFGYGSTYFNYCAEGIIFELPVGLDDNNLFKLTSNAPANNDPPEDTPNLPGTTAP